MLRKVRIIILQTIHSENWEAQNTATPSNQRMDCQLYHLTVNCDMDNTEMQAKERAKNLLEKEPVFVYDISSEDKIKLKDLQRIKAADWDVSNPARICKLTVVATDSSPKSCLIQLHDKIDQLFGESVIHFYSRGLGTLSTLTPVLDSSRYFTLELQNVLSGEAGVVGIGFADKTDSADLTKFLGNYFEATKRPLASHIEDSNNNTDKRIKLDDCNIQANNTVYVFEAKSKVKIDHEEAPNALDTDTVWELKAKVNLEAEEKRPEEFPVKVKQEAFPDHQTEIEYLDLKTGDESTTVNEVQPSKESQVESADDVNLPDPSGSATTVKENMSKELSYKAIEEAIRKKVADTTDAHRYHQGGDAYVCHLCSASFTSNKDDEIFVHWEQIHQLVDAHQRVCHMCYFLFSNQAEAIQHQSLFHIHKCPQCPDIKATLPNLNIHCRCKHNKSVNYKCEACNVYFFTRDEFTTHNTTTIIHAPETQDTIPRQHFVKHTSMNILVPVQVSAKTIFHYSNKTKKKHLDWNERVPTYNVIPPFEDIKKILDAGVAVRFKLPSSSDLRCHKCPAMFYPADGKVATILDHWHDVHGIVAEKLICKTCSLIFKKEAKAVKHRKIFHNYKCAQCRKKFENEKTLQFHMLGVHNQSLTYTCKTCCGAFYRRKEIRNHRSTVECVKAKKGETNNEGAAIPVQNLVDPSMSYMYRVLDGVQCHLCPFTARCSTEKHSPILRHWEQVHGITHISRVCITCSVVFPNKAEKIEHMDVVHNFVCPHCSNQLTSEPILHEHVLSAHHLTLRYQCQPCQVSFDTRKEFWAHNKSMKAKHFANDTNHLQLFNHMKVVSQEEPTTRPSEFKDMNEQTPAKVVNMRLNRKKLPFGVQEHFEDSKAHRYRLGTNAVVCHLCAFTYKGNDQVVLEHFRVAHDLVTRNCICSQCKFIFSNTTDKARHSDLAHNFGCPHCTVVYGTEKSLRKHMRGVHSQPVQYECEMCVAVFRTRCEFREHKEKFHPCNNSGLDSDKEPSHRIIEFALQVSATGYCSYKRIDQQSSDSRLVDANSTESNIPAVSGSSAQQILDNSGSYNFPCHHCPKSFINQISMQHHFNMSHNQTSQFRCEECSLICYTKEDCKNHFENTHDRFKF